MIISSLAEGLHLVGNIILLETHLRAVNYKVITQLLPFVNYLRIIENMRRETDIFQKTPYGYRLAEP